jgi:outer membrane protein insertion porin family
VRIFTVNRESGSSLKCKASRSRIAHAASVFAVVVLAVSSLSAQVAPGTSTAPLSSQGVETLCQPQVIGNRRIPKESILSRLFSRQNDLYDPQVVERDFNSLWNTGYFDNIQIERVDSPKCVQLVIVVSEKPTIRDINYKGLNAVTVSDVLERFKKAKVAVSVESQYDPTKMARAVVVLKDLLAEHGHQFATVTPEIKKIPPAGVSILFVVKEGPTVKVGKIAFQGNDNLSDRTLRGAMKNLRPIGIPNSIILENLFARTFDASKLDEDTERVRAAYQDRGYFKAQTGEPTTHVRDSIS